MSEFFGNIPVDTDKKEGGYCVLCKNPVEGEDYEKGFCPICREHTDFEDAQEPA